MRAEGVLRLMLNVSLYVGMTLIEDGKHVRSTVFEDGERRLVTFRVCPLLLFISSSLLLLISFLPVLSLCPLELARSIHFRHALVPSPPARHSRAPSARADIQLGSQKAASELMANIQDHIPLESDTKSPTPGPEVKGQKEEIKPAWL